MPKGELRRSWVLHGPIQRRLIRGILSACFISTRRHYHPDLFMLVSALMGLDRMQAVYAHAIASEYRFYSYGDSSLLLP
ncbi:hypothetical protein HNO88_000452 [Novosphingobium chloroacetimidivorans]|uniref:S-adenosylmethionine:tRNA ribosyltransferase-isomerase n=1 Tax=Novosphingobium chloroacetimidivorans TaxID=1428314 RepID=A0A7W7K6I6_9SPHN|nr:hypothetical protein [Novosphingobium chloroacetimidivorans]